MRLYQGVNSAAVSDPRARESIKVMDDFLREVARALSTNQPATGPNSSGIASGLSFVCMANESSLSNERKLGASSPIVLSDGGANANATVGIDLTLLGATPALTYANSVAAGVATTFLRTDAQIKFPNSLLSDANFTTLTLSDNGTDQTLTGSLGILNVNPNAGMTINLGASTLGSLQIIPNATTAPLVTCFVNIRPGLGNNIGLRSQFLAGAPTGSIAAWDAVVNPGGIYTGATLNGFLSSTFAAAPGAGSDNNNKMYGINLGQQFRIASGNAGWLEVATAYFKGVTRLVGTPTINVQAGVIIEPPTASTNDQFGLLIRQQTAQNVATNRTGIRIDSQNSGTNRLSIDAEDKVLIVNPSGIGSDCLELRQNNSGAVAGAHILFSSKAGDPPAPTQGQMWHNGGLLMWYDTAKRVIATRDATETFTNKTLSGVTIADATNVVIATATGTKIGTAANQKIGFWNAAPVVQPATTGTILGFVAGGGVAVDDKGTFTGNTGATAYTISDVVANLKAAGILAA